MDELPQLLAAARARRNTQSPQALLASERDRRNTMDEQQMLAQEIGAIFRPRYPELPVDYQAPGYFGRGMTVRMG